MNAPPPRKQIPGTDAEAGVLQSVTAKWDVPIHVARGFSSLTFLHATASDIEAIDNGAIEYDHAIRILHALADKLGEPTHYSAGRLIEAYETTLKTADPIISNGADWLLKLAEQADESER